MVWRRPEVMQKEGSGGCKRKRNRMKRTQRSQGENATSHYFCRDCARMKKKVRDEVTVCLTVNGHGSKGRASLTVVACWNKKRVPAQSLSVPLKTNEPICSFLNPGQFKYGFEQSLKMTWAFCACWPWVAWIDGWFRRLWHFGPVPKL